MCDCAGPLHYHPPSRKIDLTMDANQTDLLARFEELSVLEAEFDDVELEISKFTISSSVLANSGSEVPDQPARCTARNKFTTNTIQYAKLKLCRLLCTRSAQSSLPRSLTFGL